MVVPLDVSSSHPSEPQPTVGRRRDLPRVPPRGSSVGIVGGGPAAVYLLDRLLAAGFRGSISVFETGPELGCGMPYDRRQNHPQHLANITSVELPPLGPTLLEWFRDVSRDEGRYRDLLPAPEVDDRTFLPRVVIGDYFRDQARRLVAEARQAGIRVAIHTGTLVSDLRATRAGAVIHFRGPSGELRHELFSQVVLATGHRWPDGDAPQQRRFASPWPISKVTALEVGRLGVLGSSLSALDTCLAYALEHGNFCRDESGVMTYRCKPGSAGFGVSLLSRKGLLPEVDRWCPVPYEPVEGFRLDETRAEIKALPPGERLETLHARFLRALTQEAPAYVEELRLSSADMAGFAEAYFRQRRGEGPEAAWRRAEEQLAEALAAAAEQRATPGHYALMRMHETWESLLVDLDPVERRRFDETLAPVFVDVYAGVPPLSMERLLALRRAGCVEVVALGAKPMLREEEQRGGMSVCLQDGWRYFDHWVDATGQRHLPLTELPFPSLAEQLRQATRVAARTASRAMIGGLRATPDAEPDADLVEALTLDAGLRLRLGDLDDRTAIHLMAAPYLLGRLPFVQGLGGVRNLAEVVSANLLRWRAVGEEMREKRTGTGLRAAG